MADMELYRRLGKAVAKERSGRGMTQVELAEKLDISRASLANLETGRQRIMVHQLYALVNALKLKSILDLVPENWAFAEPLPELRLAGSALNAKEQSAVENLVASLLTDDHQRKRS
jgi:transcriptional regulator with XRE-family HTH domain